MVVNDKLFDVAFSVTDKGMEMEEIPIRLGCNATATLHTEIQN